MEIADGQGQAPESCLLQMRPVSRGLRLSEEPRAHLSLSDTSCPPRVPAEEQHSAQPSGSKARLTLVKVTKSGKAEQAHLGSPSGRGVR